MNIPKTYAKLEELVQEQGEECGIQLRESKALNNLYATGLGGRIYQPA